MEEGLPREVSKSWGSELWFAHTDQYAGKILRVRTGCRFSVRSSRSRLHSLRTSSVWRIDIAACVTQNPEPGEPLDRCFSAVLEA